MLVTHVKASVEDIEKMGAWHGGVEEILKMLKQVPEVEECAVLKTCNRVEVYVVSKKGSKVLLNFAKKMKVSSRIVDFLDHEESLRHLLRLAAGIESMIVGEDQILGQMKELYNLAKKAKATGRVLDLAFNKAIQVGKRVRNETKINKGSVSIGSAAVDLAEDVLGGLKGRTVMVIGAGEMGSLVARALANRNIKVIYVANRTFERAKELAQELKGQAVNYNNILEYMETSDVVIAATSAPHTILNREMLEGLNRKEKLLLIDIGNPRNISEDVKELPNVELYNLDSLKRISERNLELRREEAKKAEKIIEEELELLKLHYKRQKAEALLSAIYRKVEEIRLKEKRQAINRLSAYHTMGKIEEEVIDDLTHSFANQILAHPTKFMKTAAEEGDEEALEIVSELFGLNGSK